MFIREKKSPHNPKKISVQIVESVRDGKRVKQRIVRHVGVAMDEQEVEKLKDLAELIKAKIEHEHTPSLFSPEELASLAISSRKRKDEEKELYVDLKKLEEEQRVTIGFHEAYGKIYEQLGFDSLLKSRHGTSANNILRHIVMARIANPCSKRASVMLLEEDFGIRLDLNKVYRMMDKLDDQVILQIQKNAYHTTLSLFNDKIDVIFFDATTLYFESFTEDELKQNGFSKDHKFNQPQVIFSLMVTKEGLPIGYNVFPGSTYEGHTLVSALDKIKKQYQIDKVVFVADAGMLQEKNLSLLEAAGYEYIISARLKNLSSKFKEEILSQDFKKEKIKDLSFSENRKLILHYSEKRAYKEAKDRDKAVSKLLKKVKKSKNATSLISNYGYKKYLKMKGKTEFEINEEKLQQEAQWDGLCGIFTNSKDLSNEKIIEQYKGLWQVEESFRISKHDLKVRPIYHWTPQRIQAHIAISFMSFCCVRLLEYRTKIQYKKLSPKVIRHALSKIQISILKDWQNQRYVLPSRITTEGKKIYQILGLKSTSTPFKLESPKPKFNK